MGGLTKNFNRAEFACHGKNCCGGAAPISLELVRGLQALRDRQRQPLTITSGFRCPRHNSAIGGARQSQHLYGIAADIATPPGLTAETLYKTAAALNLFHGLGLYDWGIHVDLRGAKARWDYRIKE